jgi:hypothetical protein
MSSTVSISLSGGACRTMTTDPVRQIAQPSFPRIPNSSCKKYAPRTAPIRTLKAPSGVTRMAGANAYAAKLKTSPKPRVMMPAHHKGVFMYENPSPSKPCLSAASLRPFLVITKLVPMATEEDMARASPMYLLFSCQRRMSSSIPMSCVLVCKHVEHLCASSGAECSCAQSTSMRTEALFILSGRLGTVHRGVRHRGSQR